MKTSSKKAKGRRFQQEVRDCIIKQFNLTEDDVRSAIMGERGADIILSAKGRKAFPYSVECKNQEKYSSLYRDFFQATNHTKKGPKTPVLFIKMNRQEALAVVSFEHFMELVSGR